MKKIILALSSTFSVSTFASTTPKTNTTNLNRQIPSTEKSDLLIKNSNIKSQDNSNHTESFFYREIMSELIDLGLILNNDSISQGSQCIEPS